MLILLLLLHYTCILNIVGRRVKLDLRLPPIKFRSLSTSFSTAFWSARYCTYRGISLERFVILKKNVLFIPRLGEDTFFYSLLDFIRREKTFSLHLEQSVDNPSKIQLSLKRNWRLCNYKWVITWCLKCKVKETLRALKTRSFRNDDSIKSYFVKCSIIIIFLD